LRFGKKAAEALKVLKALKVINVTDKYCYCRCHCHCRCHCRCRFHCRCRCHCHFQIPITDHRLPITDYRLPITLLSLVPRPFLQRFIALLSGISITTQTSWVTIKKMFISPGKNRAVMVTPNPILFAPELIENVRLTSEVWAGKRK